MLRPVLAFVLVVMVMGEGCCPPDAWEGFTGAMYGWVRNGKPHLTKGFLKVHLNNTLRMVEMEGDVVVDGWEMKMKIIQDYNKHYTEACRCSVYIDHFHSLQNIEYFIMDGKCIKQTLGPKVPQCIPENATLLLNTYFGAGSENMTVKIYWFMFGDVEVYSTVTASSCIPVEIIATGLSSDTRASFMEVVQRSGITVGVKDQSVFYIPSICESVGISSGYVPVLSRWMQSVIH